MTKFSLWIVSWSKQYMYICISEIYSGCMKYWNLTFQRNFARRLRTVWGSRTHKNRTQIEVLDKKMLTFRPGTVGRHTSTLRLLSFILFNVGLVLFTFASAGGRDELSADSLVTFVRCLAVTVCQTAQDNMIWSGVSWCLINDISNLQVSVLHASWIYLTDIYILVIV